MSKILRHTLEVRLFHWLFSLAVTIKLWSGFYISFPHPLLGFPNLYYARMAHATMTPVLAALLFFRIYYALLSRDWREVLFCQSGDLVQLRSWLRYFFFLENKPPARHKYNSLQRLIFTMLFLFMTLFYGTGIVMLDLPYFRWLHVFRVRLGIARLLHYLAAVFLLAAVVFHVYLSLTLHAGKLLSMFSGYLRTPSRAGDEGGDGS